MLNNSTPQAGSCKADRPKKPYPAFPLTPHPSGKWQKKIRGRIYYFGQWAKRVNGQLVRIPGDGWKEALELYKAQADDLHAGRTPRAKTGETTLGFLGNHFLTHKLQRLGLSKEDVQKLAEMPSAEWLPFLVKKADPGNHRISPRMVLEYKHTVDRLIRKFGKDRLVSDLHPDDFTSLENDLAKQYGPVRRGNEIQKTRTLFKHAFESGLIKTPVQYGPGFRKPDRKELRANRASKPKKLFEPAELGKLIDGADMQLRAMILLGINCAFGNHDIAMLPLSALDLEKSWADFPRTKTAIPRRCWLWPETIQALQAAIAARQEPRTDDAKEKVFVTTRGRPWLVRGIANPVSVAFRNLLKASELHQSGFGFYTLRHVFRTVADATKDVAAIRLVMGHADGTIDAVYRVGIDDARLVAVSEHVRAWLFGKPDKDETGKPDIDTPKFPNETLPIAPDD